MLTHVFISSTGKVLVVVVVVVVVVVLVVLVLVLVVLCRDDCKRNTYVYICLLYTSPSPRD